MIMVIWKTNQEAEKMSNMESSQVKWVRLLSLYVANVSIILSLDN